MTNIYFRNYLSLENLILDYSFSLTLFLSFSLSLSLSIFILNYISFKLKYVKYKTFCENYQ